MVLPLQFVCLAEVLRCLVCGKGMAAQTVQKYKETTMLQIVVGQKYWSFESKRKQKPEKHPVVGKLSFFEFLMAFVCPSLT